MKQWEQSAPGRENLRQVEVNPAAPGPNQILVRVSAVALNYRDKLAIEEGFTVSAPYPFVPASDMAGVVTAVGPGTSRFKTGDRVMSVFYPDWIDGIHFTPSRSEVIGATGGAHPGVLADYIILDEQWAVASPANLTDSEAATLPCAALTAWYALVERGCLRAGQSVLVHGTGGVSLFGLQIAKAFGAIAIVISGDDSKLANAKALGADTIINRNAGDWLDAVRSATGGRGVDHVLETVGGPNLGRSIKVTARGGRVSLIGALDGFEYSGDFVDLALNLVAVEGIAVGHRRSLEDLARACEAVSLKPVIAATYPMADLTAALDLLDRGPFGKIILET